jgi:hypothetical protein
MAIVHYRGQTSLIRIGAEGSCSPMLLPEAPIPTSWRREE